MSLSDLLDKWMFGNHSVPFVQNKQEFLSVWDIAHAWEGLDAELTGVENIPASVQHQIEGLLLAYFRQEIKLRRPNGYLLVGHRVIDAILFLDKNYDRLWDQLQRKKPLDKNFLNHLYVKRSEILDWCDKERRPYPPCWDTNLSAFERKTTEDSDDQADSWYDSITQQRKEKIACLEVAKFLWEQNPELTYEQVRLHPAMDNAGLRYVFTTETFKRWARNIAPEQAKKGGRRSNSTS